MILIEEMPKKSIKLFEVNEKGTIDIVNDVYYQEAFYSCQNLTDIYRLGSFNGCLPL